MVYPQPKPKGFDPLAYLARYFDTIEIDSTFYRPHGADVAKRWAERVAFNPRFRFTAKLYRRFTHERESAWTAAEVDEARAGFEALQAAGRLGAVLLQFPWSFKRGEREQEWLRDLLRAFEGLPRVVEVRHASWNVPDHYAELEERGVGVVNVDQPIFRRSIRPGARATAAVGYIRVHGRNYQDWFRKDAGRDARYDYLYSAEELAPWAARAKALAADRRTEEIYVVTNNHFRGQAAANAVMLASMIEGHPVEAPAPLLHSFPAPLAPFVRGDPMQAGAPTGHSGA